MSSILDDLGVRPVINCAGPLTRLGGARLPEEVLAAMADAARSHVKIDELQQAAGREIARVTGAEAGYVTSGAAAGLTLAAAACIAGMDPAKMDRLPDTEGKPNEIVVQRAHRNAYDHALRAAGARLVDVGYLGYPGAGGTLPWQIEAAITERTVAIAWPVMQARGVVSLPEVTAIARRHRLPVIVDAAAALPPPGNLRRFIAEGAGLVTFSGGKAIRGPQASGILCGRADLVQSVALQHQDMDVDPRTWTHRDDLLASGRLPGPPHHGLGRSMKAGKEEIAGLIVALRLFLRRDFDAERRRWAGMLAAVAAELQDLPGIKMEMVDEPTSPRAYPLLRIGVDPAAAGITAVDAVNRLEAGDPRVAVALSFIDQSALAIVPTELDEPQVGPLLSRLRRVLSGG